ncbi:MAG TPA: hypothetical protein VJR89_02000 [Polyangiales bacterium]|nr:hypothetical protein [Polyangiales bacterium]
MNLLVVERGADWAHWAATSHLVGHAMLVLAQQGDEPRAAFRKRIRSRLSRITKQGLNAVVVLRGRGRAAHSDDIVREIQSRAPVDIRVFPAQAPATAQ